MPSAATIISTFTALREAGVQSLLLAEWGLSTSRATALPHLLAVLLQSVDPIPEGNVRTVLSPAAYISAAKEAGWTLVADSTISPSTELEDGKWEVLAARSVVKTHQLEQVGAQHDERSAEAVKIEALRAHAAALESSLPGAKVDNVAAMNVWTAVFRPVSGLQWV